MGVVGLLTLAVLGVTQGAPGGGRLNRHVESTFLKQVEKDNSRRRGALSPAGGLSEPGLAWLKPISDWHLTRLVGFIPSLQLREKGTKRGTQQEGQSLEGLSPLVLLGLGSAADGSPGSAAPPKEQQQQQEQLGGLQQEG